MSHHTFCLVLKFVDLFPLPIDNRLLDCQAEIFSQPFRLPRILTTSAAAHYVRRGRRRTPDTRAPLVSNPGPCHLPYLLVKVWSILCLKIEDSECLKNTQKCLIFQTLLMLKKCIIRVVFTSENGKDWCIMLTSLFMFFLQLSN